MTVKYVVRKLSDVSKERSSCGFRQRLITSADFEGANITFLSVYEAGRHYHKKTTEFYYVLKGSGHLELDGEKVEMEPGTLVMINPGTKHRAVGELEALIIGVPPFTEDDMYLCE